MMGIYCEKSVYMGLNEIIPDKIEEIKNLVEEFGEVEVSWTCTGRTLHYNLALQVADMLPEYDFDIEYESYKCICKKKSLEKICVICGEPIEGWGNNAEPVLEGTCCDKCNAEQVIPKRIAELLLLLGGKQDEE